MKISSLSRNAQEKTLRMLNEEQSGIFCGAEVFARQRGRGHELTRIYTSPQTDQYYADRQRLLHSGWETVALDDAHDEHS